MRSLLKPLPRSYTGHERAILSVPEKQADSRESTQQDNLDGANIGQLSPSEKDALMKVLREFADVFAANPKAVAACRGTPMRLELKDPNSVPCVALIRHYTLEQRKMIQADIEKLNRVRATVASTSQYASCCLTMRKIMGSSE